MRKRVLGKQLGRSRKSRNALFKGLASSLFKYGKITTTKAKAQAVIIDIDHMVNLAKKNTSASLRQLYSSLGNNKEAVKNLIVVAPKLGDRNSGYVRMVRLPVRLGDGAQMARLEWVVDVSEKPKPKSKAKEEEKTVKSKKVEKKSKLVK